MNMYHFEIRNLIRQQIDDWTDTEYRFRHSPQWLLFTEINHKTASLQTKKFKGQSDINWEIVRSQIWRKKRDRHTVRAMKYKRRKIYTNLSRLKQFNCRHKLIRSISTRHLWIKRLGRWWWWWSGTQKPAALFCWWWKGSLATKGWLTVFSPWVVSPSPS